MTTFPEPTDETADPAGLFARYLDFYRETVVERRWLVWGFLGEQAARSASSAHRAPTGGRVRDP